MDILSIIGIIGIIVGIIAGMVQVYDFFQKRAREKEKSKNTSKPQNIQTDKPKKEKTPTQVSKHLGRSKILKHLDQSELLVKEACKKFEAQTIHPEDCDDIAEQMLSVWDNHLIHVFEELDSMENGIARFRKMKSESRALSSTIFHEIHVMIQDLKVFRNSCLDQNNPSVPKQKHKIYDALSNLKSRLQGMKM